MELARAESTTPPGDDRSVSPLIFVAALLRERRLIAGIALLGIVSITAYTLIRGPVYSSTLTFMPQVATGNLSGLAGVAAQFGIAVPSGSPDQTPQFYAELMATGPFEEDLVATQFSAVVGKTADGKVDSVVTQPLVDWLNVDPDRLPGERLAIATVKLSNILAVVPDVQSGLVTATVTTSWPELSNAVARRSLDLVNSFNSVRRGADAGVERRFEEGRLLVARDSLAIAEDRVRMFLERNRTYLNSPLLVLEHDRLQREVDFDVQVVATLMQAVEQARITEVRNTPVVTVIEAPRIAALHDRRRFLLKWTLAIMLAVIIGSVVAITKVGFRVEEDRSRDASSAWRGAWDATMVDLRWLVAPIVKVWRRVRRSGA